MSSKSTPVASSARRKEIESLFYWPRVLAALIAEYSTPTQNECLELLLPVPEGQIVIIHGNKYSTLSMHWTDVIGHT